MIDQYEEPVLSQSFTAFIAEERMRFAGDNNNRAAFSLVQVARYVRFVGHVYSRYDEIAQVVDARFKKISQQMRANRDMTEAEQADALDGWKYDVLLHLEVESFFLFTNILLGKIAQCIEDYFGPAQGLTLASHKKMCKNIKAYATDKGLNLPIDWVEKAENLRTTVTNYRDKHITHFKNPRALHGTSFSLDGGVTGMTTFMLYTKESDSQTTSHKVGEVYEDISGYCNLFLELIHMNHDYSRYAGNAA